MDINVLFYKIILDSQLRKHELATNIALRYVSHNHHLGQFSNEMNRMSWQSHVAMIFCMHKG